MKTEFWTKNKKYILFALAAIAVALLGVFLVFSGGIKAKRLAKELGNRICEGVFLGEVNVGGMTKAQAKRELEAMESTLKEIRFKYDDTAFTIMPEEIAFEADLDAALDRAYAVGRLDDYKKNKKDVASAKKSGIKILPEVSYDKDKLFLIISEKLADYLADPSPMNVEVGEDCLVVTNAQAGTIIDADKTCKNLEQVLSSFARDKAVTVVIKKKEAKAVSTDEFIKKYRKEAKDATYDKSTGVITPEVHGIVFDEEEARKILEENKDNKESYKIPAEIVIPDVTAKELEDRYINKIIAQFSTSFAGSTSARITNITIAARKMDGYVVNPGQRFSYNAVVGPRTEAAGFKKAQSYSGTDVIEDVGGGVCQVSTTLYNAVVFADLKVVTRTNHSMPVSYVPMGRDAAVAYGILDFVFENNKSYPVSIDTSVNGTTLTVAIVGSSDKDYTVEFQTRFIENVGYSTTTVEDPSMPVGETRVISSGSTGSVYESYRVYKRNGAEYKRKFEAKTRYQPVPEKIAVGTKQTVPSEDITEENK